MVEFTDLFELNGTKNQEKNTRANDVNRTLQLNNSSSAADTFSDDKYDFTQSITVTGTPSASGAGDTWLELDTGNVYKSTGSGTGSWVFFYNPMIVGSSSGVDNSSIGGIKQPLVNFDLQNDLNLIRSAGGYGSETFTRSTVKNYIDRYGVVQQAAIDTAAFEKEGLLLEGASTNLALYSEDFSNAIWTLNGDLLAPVQDGTLAADGAKQMWKLESSNFASALNTLMQIVPITDAGQDISLSVEIKAGTSDKCRIRTVLNGGTGPSGDSIFNMTSETWTTESVNHKNFGFKKLINGSYRIFLSLNPNNTGTTSVRYRIGGGDNTTIYSTFAQFEELPFVSSYIITTASAETRTADLLTIPYSENYPLFSDDVTVLLDFDILGFTTENQQRLFDIPGVSTITMQVTNASKRLIAVQGSAPGTKTSTVDLVANTKYRGIQMLTSGGLTVGLDGVVEGNPTTVGDIVGTISGTIRLGAGASTFYMYGHISTFKIYDKSFSTSKIRIA